MNRARAITGGQAFVPFNVGGTAATLDIDFTRGAYAGISGASAFTVTRTGVSTSGRSSDATGSSYTSFAPNTIRIISGSGLLVEETRTQYLGVTDTPATQTTASLGTGSYTLWVIGTGSATPSAGTATITGAAAATAGSPNTFTVTVAGTVTVTVSGSLTRFQLENGAFATSYIPNHGAAGTSVTRGAETVSLTSTNFSDWFGAPSAYTIYAEIFQNQLVANSRFFSLSDGTNLVLLSTPGVTTNYRGLWQSGGASQADMTPASAGAGPNAVVKLATAGATNDFAMVRNAGTVSTDNAGTVLASPTSAFVGCGASGVNAINGLVRRVAFFPARLSNSNLQALTTV